MHFFIVCLSSSSFCSWSYRCPYLSQSKKKKQPTLFGFLQYRNCGKQFSVLSDPSFLPSPLSSHRVIPIPASAPLLSQIHCHLQSNWFCSFPQCSLLHPCEGSQGKQLYLSISRTFAEDCSGKGVVKTSARKPSNTVCQLKHLLRGTLT